MAIFKVVNGNYNDDDIYEKVCSYIHDNGNHIAELVGGYGVFMGSDVRSEAAQMKYVADYYMKTKGQKIYHFVISFHRYSEYWVTNEIAYRIVSNIFCVLPYQSVFAVHEDTDNIHVHVVMNAVSYMDGSKFENNREVYDSIAFSLELESKQYSPFYKSLKFYIIYG